MFYTFYIACLIAFGCNSLYGYKTFGLSRDAINIAKQYLPSNPVILEAGAYDGTESIFFAQMFPYATIHTFEPVPELYQQLVVKTSSYHNIFTYQLALGDFIGTAQFHISKIGNEEVPSSSSSLLAPKEHLIQAPGVVFYKTITVPVTTIDAWAAQRGVDNIDFMWLDMQGYELNALKASPKILKTVKVILTEVEIIEAYEGQYLYQDIKKFLEHEGFKMIATNFDAEGKTGMWYGDVLFVRVSNER